MKYFSTLILGLTVLSSHAGTTDPYFATGPLLAYPGHVLSRGQTNFTLYNYNSYSTGIYDRVQALIPQATFTSQSYNGIFAHGFTDRIDAAASLTYVYNKFLQASGAGLADTTVTLGYQIIEQAETQNMDLRFTITESFPTGRYQYLGLAANGTDATGLGSYQTGFGLNFQYLSRFFADHYIRTHICLGYFFAAPVHIHGVDAYGGNELTNGSIIPGDTTVLDLAAEISVTQKWAVSLEGFFTYMQGSTFKGNVGTPQFHRLGQRIQEHPFAALNRLRNRFPNRWNIGSAQEVGHGHSTLLSAAPAFEYSFNANYGIIAGVWFSVDGSKNTPEFISPSICFSATW